MKKKKKDALARSKGHDKGHHSAAIPAGEQTGMARYDAARQALAETHNLDEVRDISNKAEALRIYARQAKDLEMQNWAAAIRLRAKRRAGELLGEVIQRGGSQSHGRVTLKDGSQSHTRVTLKDLETTKRQSAEWQKLSKDISDDSFESAFKAVLSEGKELTTAVLLKQLKVPVEVAEINTFDELWKTLARMLPYQGDGQDHILIQLLEAACKAPIRTLDDQTTLDLIIGALKEIPVDFAAYADRLASHLKA